MNSRKTTPDVICSQHAPIFLPLDPAKSMIRKLLTTARLSILNVPYSARILVFKAMYLCLCCPTSQKKPRGRDLTEVELRCNRILSSGRISVEHAMAGVKRSRIVKDVLRNSKLGFSDRVMEIACCGGRLDHPFGYLFVCERKYNACLYDVKRM